MKYLTRSFLYRFYARQQGIEQILMLSCLFSLALVVFRVLYTGDWLFVFLVWNLFLAFVPYAFSRRLARFSGRKSVLLAGAALWLLFIPNAFYILTDLFHLDENKIVPQWYDLALLLSFAWNGLLFGILSVWQMEKLVEQHFNRRPGLLFVLPVMFLNGLGVYIGRYLRFNSWDIIADPFQLATDIAVLFVHPFRSRLDWSMIVCYSLLMTLIYLGVKKIRET